jgi:hypothetical protein
VRLAITAEEWCGNSYLEWIASGDEVNLLGRSYMEDSGRLTTQIAVKAGYYLYEQLPVLVRALALNDEPLTLRMIAPQTANLEPHAREVQVLLACSGYDIVTTPAGDFPTIVVTVTPVDSSESFFPQAETYWIEASQRFIVQAERNELTASADGRAIVHRAVYQLQDYRRMPYWRTAAPPLTPSLADRRRATHSSWVMLNFTITSAREQGKQARFDNIHSFFSAEPVPCEFLSSATGSNRIAREFDGSGGWWFDEDAGRFELNVHGASPSFLMN